MLFPESSNDIEDFYRRHLSEIEITPPEAMWEKVKIDLPKGRTGGFSAANWGVASIGGIVVAVSIIVWKSAHVSDTASMAPMTPIAPATIKEQLTKTVSEQPVPTVKKELKLEKGERLLHSALSHPQETIKKTEEVPLTEPVTAEEPKPIQETASEKIEISNQEANDTEISYFEKIKNKSKDSLRPLFIPKK